MHDPKSQPIDIDEQREWLKEHKDDTGLSWTDLSGRIGIAKSTLSLFVHNKYGAPGDTIAAAVYRYRQTLASQAAINLKSVEIPEYFPTETSGDLINLLQWAQRGRIVLGALGPGLSKTITSRYYQACNTNVFLTTISPATAGIRSMQHAVLIALGDRSASGNMEALSKAVKDRVRHLNKPLLILDEAQHLTVASIEEIRHWHDETGLGIALFGNETVQQRLDGGNRSAAFAQIFSRVSMKLVRSKPLTGDVEAMLDAWNIHDEKVAKEIHRIAQLPGALRGVTFTLELASMLALSANEDLSIGHVQDAWTQLSRRTINT